MKKLLFTAMAATAIAANAQTDAIPSGADNLKAYAPTDCMIPFDVKAEGKAFPVKWGMDTSWDWDYNVNRGVAHIGKGNFATGRVSFQPTEYVIDKGNGVYELTTKQKNALKSRINHIKLTGVTEVNINCDQEVMPNPIDASNPSVTGITNYKGKPEEYYKLIKASVDYCQKNGLKIISISPFNEPDLDAWQQGSKEDFLTICKLIRQDSFFDGIRICGGNTLNCDKAWEWYSYLKDYLDEGNTHQLAGSFDNYASFFTKVKQDGKIATADELHNVGEAIVGVEYGVENGIWWAFDAKARGQFCLDSNEGVRIGYGEDRTNWTSGAVYRNEKSGEIHGYLGSSERQATNSTISFLSTDRDVYFNGYGPTRQYSYSIPGGTGYQKGQINAERLFDITYGEDVPPLPEINGDYQIMNAFSGKLLTFVSGNGNVKSETKKAGFTQQWTVYPGYTDGDMSYWFIDYTHNPELHLNLLNTNLNAGAGVITYNANHAHEEQWYIKYAKDGYYYIIARLSNKYLHCSNTTSGTLLYLRDAPTEKTSASELKKYLWRFMPIDANAETKAPAAPTALKARMRPGSIQLSWTAPADNDLDSYTIIRGEKKGEEVDWNTIARQIKQPAYLDNSLKPGASYIYKVIAVDKSGNRSTASETIEATTLQEEALLMQLQFDKALTDNTPNRLNAAVYGTPKYSTMNTLKKSGTASLQMDGNFFVSIMPSVVNQDELTIATWFRLDAGAKSWQRLFDFGNGETQYMFFTPNNGSEMRFVMKDEGDEQIITTGNKLQENVWKHVAVTIAPLDNGKVKAVLYIDGEAVAQSEEFTIKPSDIAPAMCYIGRSMFKNDPLLKGRVDDFRVYNKALTEDQIKAIMEDVDEVSKDVNDNYKDSGEAIPGDVNEDGTVDVNDVVRLVAYVLDNTVEINKTIADVNGDGKIDYSDVAKLVSLIAD